MGSLTNGTAYSFQVRAKNGVGYGSAASASATPAAKPGAPGSFTASRGNGEVTLSWSEADANGSAVEFYQTRYKTTTGGSWSTWSKVSGDGSARRGTVGSLTNGTAYSFQVRARNGVGFGSTATQSATPATKPGKPTGVSVTTTGSQSLSVSWTAPSDNGGSALTGAQVQYCKTNEVPACDMGYVSWGSTSVSGASTTTASLTGLSSGTGYTVRVRAKNGVGSGSWSTRATGRTRTGARSPDGDDETAAAKLAAAVAPNPFNPTTTIRLQLVESGPVTLVLYSITGQVVRKLILSQHRQAGTHTLIWDGHDDRGFPVAGGVYLYRLIASERTLVGKMTLLR